MQLDFSVAECFVSQQAIWTLLMIVELLGCVSSFQRNRQSCSSGGFCAQNHVLSFLFDIWCYLSRHWLHSFQAPLSQRVLAECSWPQELFLKGKKVSVQHSWKSCGLIDSFVWWAIAKLIETGIYLYTGILYRVTELGFCNIGLYWLCQYEPPKRGKILCAWISFVKEVRTVTRGLSAPGSTPPVLVSHCRRFTFDFTSHFSGGEAEL